jgi:E1A-binding protein p400
MPSSSVILGNVNASNIAAELKWLEEGNNLLDFLLAPCPAPVLAPALRGAAAASAAAKAARVAAQSVAQCAPVRKASPPSQSCTQDMASKMASCGSQAMTSMRSAVNPTAVKIPSNAFVKASNNLARACNSGCMHVRTATPRVTAISLAPQSQQAAGWEIKRWNQSREPQRNKSQWDYLLEEMEWLSKDFREERSWKQALARRATRAVRNWQQDRESVRLGARSHESPAKKVARAMSFEVVNFWSQLAVAARHRFVSRMREQREELRQRQLAFLVRQASCYSDTLTVGVQLSSPGAQRGVTAANLQPQLKKAVCQAELADLQRDAEQPLDESLLQVIDSDASDSEHSSKQDVPDAIPQVQDAFNVLYDRQDGATRTGSQGKGKVTPCSDEFIGWPAIEEEVANSMIRLDAGEPAVNGQQDLISASERVAIDDCAVENRDAICLQQRHDEREHVLIESTVNMATQLMPTGPTLGTANVHVNVPFIIRGILREHQHVALNWLVSMYEKNLSGILADETGLGKTLMTIAMLAWLGCERGIWGPHLIVVPTSVVVDWEMEIKKFTPAFKVITYSGSQKERKAMRQAWSKTNDFHICITSYQLVILDQAAFRRKKWKYLVLDEAHHITNFCSQRWQTLLQFSSKSRLVLTGQPIQHYPTETWSVLHFLMPHIFLSRQGFKDWLSYSLNSPEPFEQASSILRPFLLRRLKKDVEQSLPSKIEQVVPCLLSKRQHQLYDELTTSSATRQKLASDSFSDVMNLLMHLRNVCNHTRLYKVPARSPHQMRPMVLYTTTFIAKVPTSC